MYPSDRQGPRAQGYGSSGRGDPNQGRQSSGFNRGQLEENKSDTFDNYSIPDHQSDVVTAAQIRRDLDMRQRAFNEQRGQKTEGMTAEDDFANQEIDRRLQENFSKLCAFFSEQPESSLSRKELGGNRRKFLDACRRLQHNESRTVLSIYQIKTAFQSVYFTANFSIQEYSELFRAIDAFDNPELEQVDFMKILAAPTDRVKDCRHGFFAKQKPLQTGKSDGTQPKTEKQIEEEKKLKEAEEAQRKFKEEKEKDLARLRQIQQQQAKSTVQAPKIFPDATTGTRQLGKDELKKMEREEERHRQAEDNENQERAKAESYQVVREAKEFRKMFSQVINSFKRYNQEEVQNALKTADSKFPKSGRLSMQDFLVTLSTQLKINIKMADCQRVQEVLDPQGRGDVDYNQFCEAVWNPNKFNVAKLIAEKRKRLGQNNGVDPITAARLAEASMRSVSQPGGSAFDSQRIGRDFSQTDDMSSIMGLSDGVPAEKPSIFQDTSQTDFERLQSLFVVNYNSFDELLAVVQIRQDRKKPGEESKIRYDEFARLVQNTYQKKNESVPFSQTQLQNVFRNFVRGSGMSESVDEMYIPLKDFKDIFYPGRPTDKDYHRSKKDIERAQKLRSKPEDDSDDFDKDDDGSQKSMLLDDIMQGRAIQDIIDQRNKQSEQEGSGQRIEDVFEESKRGSIKEDFENQSNYSELIDNIMAVRSGDPKRSKDDNSKPSLKADASKPSALKKGTKDKSSKLATVPEIDFVGNMEMYRQPEAHYMMPQFDLAADKLMIKVAAALKEDLVSMLPTSLSKGQEPDAGKYVDTYGKKIKGFLHFEEFEELYMAHVHFAEAGNKHVPHKLEEKQRNLIRRLFDLINPDSNEKLSKADFCKFMKNQEPASFVDRLKIKLKRGKDRLRACLVDEFQDADKKFGMQGFVPLAVFQSIVGDYDCPLSEAGKLELKNMRKGFYEIDAQKNEFIDYRALMNFVEPPPRVSMVQTSKAVLLVQSWFRGWKARKEVRLMRQAENEEDNAAVRNHLKAIDFGKKKATIGKTEEAAKGGKKQKQTEAEKAEQAKKNQAAHTRQRKGEQGLNNKMTAQVKPARDAKAVERANKLRAEATEFIKSVVLENIITKAFAYGESLQVCRDIQKKYENRPVTKFVYPLNQEFTISTQGVCSKSLQAFNQLGQVMYLNAQNQLQQFDISCNRSLAPVSLGTRPPLKHYDIIDMVVDQKSGRIYTINSNWILEIWSIEQNASFPQKRIAVCSNEGGKDFISAYYQNTFNDAKPRFLCLQESNQQVLVVNTTCVDGSIVFIDPISFSILKKIQLRYTDYELPFKVRRSIKHIMEVFNNLKKQKGKSLMQIFEGLIDPVTKEVPTRDLVDRLMQMDPTLKRPDLYETVYCLDEDQSGQISIDEFMNYFAVGTQMDEDDEYHKAQEEQLMQDESYPSWVLEQGKLAQAQTILLAIYNQLEKQGMTAEQVFQFRDTYDTGLISIEDFKRIVKIFLSDVLPEGEKLDFVLRLTNQTVDAKIRYREFCKLLTRKFVKSFKLAGSDNEESSKKKSALEIELDRPMIKEASLSYILRKAAELEIDLREILKEHDPLELSVISRINFWGLMLSLPLGLNDAELNEVFDNDLNFDNNGNVDYMQIVNSDIFVALERRRIAAQILKKKGSVEEQGKDEKEHKLSDNRKVVVEDLIFIDDLEIIIYTTIRPKTSSIFITSMCKAQKQQQTYKVDSNQKQIIELKDLDSKNIAESLQKIQERREKEAKDLNQVTHQTYPLIAKLRGHKNSFAPSISYIAHSNCLVSAEKHETGNNPPRDPSKQPKNEDPNAPINPKMSRDQRTGYQDYSYRHNHESSGACEILVWHLQKDLIDAFQVNYPWNISPHKRWAAHDASIVDICYLTKAQLLVTCGLDQTIRFWDPVAQSYELTDPSNNPHAQMKPGYYKPLLKEQTKSNMTFKEVKRVYCGSETNCYAVRALTMGGISLNPQQPEIKSQVEWLLCLKNPQQFNISKDAMKKNRVGIVCGYGIERVKIEVPAKHVDDIVPPYVMKECEDLVVQRRLKIVNTFQQRLPVVIEQINSQTLLQNSYMEKIRGLFMQAILNRKDDQFVNPIPLREVYKVILKLPARTKFEAFLASSGCSDKLSVSETFFYLQKFMQIHPLRTTQIEFEKSIEDFYRRHQRQFLQGVKKYPKRPIQHLADFIRQHGLNFKELQKDGSMLKAQQFVTREQLANFFGTLKNDSGEEKAFSDQEIDQILNELDPYDTGAIQYKVLESYFEEEIAFQKNAVHRKPELIIEKIRNLAFPNHKIALQQSLAAADEAGDGYITQTQFIDAIYRVKLEPKIDRDSLELLFDIMAERFEKPLMQNSEEIVEVKYLNLPFFFSKLFARGEDAAVSEVDQTMQMIKATMIYKGIDFGIIFAEKTNEDAKEQAKSKSRSHSRQKQDDKIDLMCHYTRFAQQIMKAEFVERIMQLNATDLSRDRVIRLANYLSLNQRAQSVIYLNTWLHHLKRVSTQFQTPIASILPIMCSKLLKNEANFRSMIEATAGLKQKRDHEKFVELADLRLVLKKFGISYINQNLFLDAFTRKNVPTNLGDIITDMKAFVKTKYAGTEEEQTNKVQLLTLGDLQKTDYFQRLQKQIQLRKSEGQDDINIAAILGKMQEFDESDCNQIHAYKLVNILKHQLPEGMLSEQSLIGLQYELECLNHDHLVDYHDFVKIFLQSSNKEKRSVNQLELGQKRTTYTLQDYEDLLGKINEHAIHQGHDVLRIFDVFSKKAGGFISYEDLRKVIQLLDYPIKEKDFELLCLHADESSHGNIHAYDLAQQIANAESVAPQFNISKWIIAARVLKNFQVLEEIKQVMPQVKEHITREFGDGKPGHECQVVTGAQFKIAVRSVCSNMSEPRIQNLTMFAIRGSQRQKQVGESNQTIDIERDLIQVHFFEKALGDVINEMRLTDIREKQAKQQNSLQLNAQQQDAKSEQVKLDAQIKKIQAKNDIKPEQLQREAALIEKVINVFRDREVSFYDAFQECYDPLAETNIISMQKFKELVRKLNLNSLTVQDHRVMRRIADPDQIGKVDLKLFCHRFETETLRAIRMNQTLDKIATAFFLQNFNLKKAFQIFDVHGNGKISKKNLRAGLATLEIGIKYDEINDLMRLVDADKDGFISYDEFITRLDANIVHRRQSLLHLIEDKVLTKIEAVLNHTGGDHPLYQAMAVYDLENEGQIEARDLIRVFKRLGLQSVEPHLPLVLRAGGVNPRSDEKIDIVEFYNNFNDELKRRNKKHSLVRIQSINKLHSMLNVLGISIFDFFVRLDTNKSGKVTKLEFKTGIQALNMTITRDEFESLWQMLCADKKQIDVLQGPQKLKSDTLRPKEAEISYYDLISGFIQSGALKFNKTTDKTDILIAAFRKQMKVMNLTVDRLYKQYDPQEVRFVFRNEFIDTSKLTGFEFDDDQYNQLFNAFASQGQKKDMVAEQEGQTFTRFTYKQMSDALTVQKDINWIYNAYIKINKSVLQKGLTYKKLFQQWKGQKSQNGKLGEKEIAAGLKKLKAGLTIDEIDKLVAQLRWDPKDQSISDKDFEATVLAGASKLQNERAHDNMELIDWISQFEGQLNRSFATIEDLFYQYDSRHEGSLVFEDFANMNEAIGVAMNKKRMNKIFDLLDRQQNKKLMLEEIKNILIQKRLFEEEPEMELCDDWIIKEQGLKNAQEVLERNKVNELYEDLKNKIEAKNVTLEQIFFTDLKLDPQSFITPEAIRDGLLKLQIQISNDEGKKIIKDVRKFYNDRFEVTLRNLVDFMTKKKINLVFTDKGAIDPLLANTVQAINKVKDLHELRMEDLFNLLDARKSGSVTKENFVLCLQGMNLPCAAEDISELFASLDEEQMNKITRQQFIEKMTFFTGKMSGPSVLDSHISGGQGKDNKQSQKSKENKSKNLQAVFQVLKDLTDAIQGRNISLKQLITTMDYQKTGYLSRGDFTSFVHSLAPTISLEKLRFLCQFLDSSDSGKVSVMEFAKLVMEIFNNNIGGGVYSFMQVQPLIHKIISGLSVDCDRFFDDVSDRNQHYIENELKHSVGFNAQEFSVQKTGLAKSIFINELNRYGVTLNDKETALISTVFSLGKKQREMLDYVKLDIAFEGVQQTLYAQSKFFTCLSDMFAESQFTVDWERRVFKQMGDYLMRHNMSIEQMFNRVDTDYSATVSLHELSQTIDKMRPEVQLTTNQLQSFVNRLATRQGAEGSYTSTFLPFQEFKQRFWAAYTYDDVFEDEDHCTNKDKEHQKVQMPPVSVMSSSNIVEANQRMQRLLEQKVNELRMFKSVQKRFKEKFEAPRGAYEALDTNNHGFLTLRDFQLNLSKHFNLSLKALEVRALFQNIDHDENGIIKYEEIESFYNRDFSAMVQEMQRNKKERTLHNEIFDHLIMILKQKGITLLQVFEEIDNDRSGYIEVEEFHDMLERMGFTIKYEQVLSLIKTMDENFDGRITYKELYNHLERLGFDMKELMGSKDDEVQYMLQTGTLKEVAKHCEHRWRDKALELLINTVTNRLQKMKSPDEQSFYPDASSKSKKKQMTVQEYFAQYDQDHDGFLTPTEFRKACLDLKEPMLKATQVERILHIVLEERKLKPLCSIERIEKLLHNYRYLSIGEGSAVLIDEDLFVYIVEKYDGISRMMDFVSNLTDKANYLQRHTYELGMRGLNMMSNQRAVAKLNKKSTTLNDLFQSTLVLLAGDITRLMKEEAVLTVLDPSKNIDNIVTDEHKGVLDSFSVPTIENSQFDVDYQSLQYLPCGAQRYDGTLLSTKEPIEILQFPTEGLQYVSLDGKKFEKHLGIELQIHRFLMGARFEEEDEMDNPNAFAEEDLDIFPNLGKFEKKVGLSVSDKEVFVINKKIDEDSWINLDDFVSKNGGILNIPLFYHTEAPLYIIRHWAKLILQIIQKVHDVSVVLRCLSTRQLWISRDGQRIRLGNVRGAGRVNNLGFLKTCPDIYLHLDNNERTTTRDDNKSTNISPSKNLGASSRRTNNDQPRMFSNKALDSPFLAPEILFSKFSDHTSALDVWAFGMILFCLMFGRKPVSYYAIYRQWLKRTHNKDVELGNLPFTRPSGSNFIYDPFSIDFENPFDRVNMDDLAATHFKQKMTLEEIENQHHPNDGVLNFSNFMKCITDLSYSGMFTAENSKKFDFKRIVPTQNSEDKKEDESWQTDDIHNLEKRKLRKQREFEMELQKAAKESDDKNSKLSVADRAREDKRQKIIQKQLEESMPYRFAGQKGSASGVRNQFLAAMAKAEILQHKNELGLILDLIASCLDVDPKKRPTIQGLLNSPIFYLDQHERTNAIRFSQNVILYRSPMSTVCTAITTPLRQICAETLKGPMNVFEHTENILKLFARVEDAIQYTSALPIDELNQVMTESEKRKGVTQFMASRGVDASKLRVSPNGPLATQIVEDKVVDMLLFLTFRYLKNFKTFKKKELESLDARIELAKTEDAKQRGAERTAESVTQGGETSKTGKSEATSKLSNQYQEVKKNMQKLENRVLLRMTHLLRTMVYQMHSYNTPMSPHVNEVIQYIVKFFIGEEAMFGSDMVLNKTCTSKQNQLRSFLTERSFFRRESELTADFKSDQADKLWSLEQKNKTFLDKSNYWCPELYTESLKIYRDAITESGRGQSCYPVICDYITSISNSFEPTKIFSKQMSHLSMSFLIPMNRTSAYYNELIPIAESLSRLYDPKLEKAGKRCSLAMVRSVFQTGNSDKIKACLDMRVPKHLVHYILDSDQDVRKECLFTYLEISKGLQDDDFEVIGKHAANLKREFAKQGYTRTTFDLHKAISMASQSEVLDAQAKIDKINASQRRGGQTTQGKSARQKSEQDISQTEAQCNYIKRTIALIEKNENEKYINFALDLPNLNFLASKRFLKEMAVCFESPVFIAPLVRLLKTQTEQHSNKTVILEIFKNLVCGNERVLIALNSPACDTYMTLLKILMANTKMQNARQNPNSSQVSTQMRQTLALQDKTIGLFNYMFEQSRPTIINDLKCIGAAATLLKEQDLSIPKLLSLPALMEYFDTVASEENILKEYTPQRKIDEMIEMIKHLRCWVKHFYAVSQIPELTRIKAMQRCMNLLVRVMKVFWRAYFEYQAPHKKEIEMKPDEKEAFHNEMRERVLNKINYMQVIRVALSFFDWLCVNNKHHFLFNEESGRCNLAFIMNMTNMILCQFRKPLMCTVDAKDTFLPPFEVNVKFGFEARKDYRKEDRDALPTMEDGTFNDRANAALQDKHKYDIFPFTDIGSILQNIQYQLVRKNDGFLNMLLSEANFGFVFGEQLLLDLDFIRHCIDNCVESLVLMDSYVKKNEIRLNTFEYIMRSSEDTLKDQLIKSNFCERVFEDYVQDFREFNIQFSKIDLEFLAFRRSYPLRLEAISLINTSLMLRQQAPQIYNEFLMYSRRHQLVKQELNRLMECVAVNSREATSLLIFAILLESNESDLIYVMVQEGAHRVIRSLMQEQPSLNKRFPVLRQFVNKF